MIKAFRDRKLLFGFAAFLMLTFCIGMIGVLQIFSLNNVIRVLAKEYIPRENTISQMKADNALYAMGVRNYVFWHTSKYLQSAAIVRDASFIDKAYDSFRKNISIYRRQKISLKEKDWIKELEEPLQELNDTGTRLMRLAARGAIDKSQINKLFMVFENRFYKINDILDNRLSRFNLEQIDTQLKAAKRQKDASIAILSLSLILSTILGVGIAYFVYKSLETERKRRQMLVNKMINIEEEERKNLSRQIHDQLSQDLGALKIYLELFEKNVPNNDQEQKDKIMKSKKILTGLIDKGHNISELLRPPQLDELGMQEAINALIKEHREITGNSVHYYKPEQEIRLAPEYSLSLYRVVQEALTNIAKYAQAKSVDVSFQMKNNIIKLTVADDGAGFNYNNCLNQPRRRKEDKLKLGLQGLKERIEILGGNFIVDTAPGKGAKIIVEIMI